MPRIHASGNVSGLDPETPLGALRELLIARQVDGEQGLSPDEGGVPSPAPEPATTTSSPSSAASSTRRSTKKTGSRAPARTTESP